MENLDEALVQWVRNKQFNQNDLSKKCSNLTELSDGILLFELLGTISHDNFDITMISLDVQNNWALKLGNLKRLKQAIQSYLTYELKVPYERINDILLGNIARKGDPDDIIKLLELVFLVILKCSQKENFIRKIMQLNEKHQYSIMLFIKKILNHEDDLVADSEIQNKEIEILKNAKNNLLSQISELQRDLLISNTSKEKYQKELEELKFANAQLQNDLDNLSSKLTNTSTDMFSKLEKKLNEKTHMLELSKQILESTRRELEEEVSKLKDELDIALANKHKLGYYETCIDKYKRKIENLLVLKKKNQDLKKDNENMQQLIKKHQFDSEFTSRAKSKIKQLKEDLAKEKNKNELFAINNECREKQLKQLQNSLIEQKEKIRFLENYCEELKKDQNSSSDSEDSRSNPTENDELKKKKFMLCSRAASLRSDCAENLYKENDRLRSLLLKTGNKKREAKENLKMLYEEMVSKEVIKSFQVSQLVNINESLASRLEDFTEENLKLEIEKQKISSLKSELENLKQKNEELSEAIKKCYSEKDEVFLRCIEAKDQLMDVKTKLNEKEMLIHQLNLEKKILKESAEMKEEQVLAMKSQLSSLSLNESSFLKIELNELSQEIKKLKMINSELEKEKKIIQEKNEENIDLLKKNHREEVEKLKHKSNFQSQQMIRDTEQALSKIQNDKEEIQAQLNFVRRNNNRELRNTLMVRDPFIVSVDEIKRVKLQLSEYLKENEQLQRDNQELLICWKESALMLRELKKSMDHESKRMQDIIKVRQNNR